MAKKRSCRRSAEEERQHDIAVSVRKMTDRQICEHLEKVRSDAWKSGHKAGHAEGSKASEASDDDVKAFLKAIQLAQIKGIGVATISKLMVYAEEHGYA